jgi:hypothetical protein
VTVFYSRVLPVLAGEIVDEVQVDLFSEVKSKNSRRWRLAAVSRAYPTSLLSV